MPLAVKISDKIYNIPFIDELTIKHLIDVRRVDPNKPLQVLTWGLGVEPELAPGKKTEREVANALALIENLIIEIKDWIQSSEAIQVPKEVDVLGVVVKLNPGLLQELPYWGTVRCKEIIKRESKNGQTDFTDFYPEIIAHYLYSKVTKSKYDEDKADEFIDVIYDLNMKVAGQLGNFFLLKQSQLFLNKRSYFLTSLTVTRKRLVSRFSQSMKTLMHWKR